MFKRTEAASFATQKDASLRAFPRDLIFVQSSMLSYIPIYALIHPHLLYALPLWGGTFSTYFTKLQRLQNIALRIIFNRKQLNPANTSFP